MIILNKNNKILTLAIAIVLMLAAYQVNNRLSTPSITAVNNMQDSLDTHRNKSVDNDEKKVTLVAVADTNNTITTIAPTPNRLTTENYLKDEASNHHMEWQQWRDTLLTPDNIFNSDYSYYDNETLIT